MWIARVAQLVQTLTSTMLRFFVATSLVVALCGFDTIEQHMTDGKQVESKNFGFISFDDASAIAYLGKNQHGSHMFAVAGDGQGAYVQLITFDAAHGDLEQINSQLYQGGNFHEITGLAFDGQYLYVWSKVTSVFVYGCDVDKIDLKGNRLWRENDVFAASGSNSAICRDTYFDKQYHYVFHHLDNAASGRVYKIIFENDGTPRIDQLSWTRAADGRGLCGSRMSDNFWFTRATSNRRMIWLTYAQGLFITNFSLGTGHTASVNCTTDGQFLYFAD